MDLLDDDDDEPEAPRGSASASASGEVAEKKQRFVWTPDLHCRFEAVLARRGAREAAGDPPADGLRRRGERAARQNIKSHLQKYRLFFSKRLGRRGAKGGGGDDDDGEPSPLDPYLERQHNGLLAQLELHAKLHTQLLIQRSTQAALSLRMSHSQGRPALHPLQLQRLARHVLMQRNMLQHLVALLHSSTVEILAERGVPPGQIEAMAHQALSPLALGVGAQGGAPRGGAFGDASASGGAGGLGAQHTLYYPDQARFGPPMPPQRFLWCRIAPESDRIRPSLPHSSLTASTSTPCRRPPRRCPARASSPPTSCPRSSPKKKMTVPGASSDEGAPRARARTMPNGSRRGPGWPPAGVYSTLVRSQ